MDSILIQRYKNTSGTKLTRRTKIRAQEFQIFQPRETLQLSSVLNKKNLGPTNHAFEQREVLLTNSDHYIDAQNFRYQNIQ